MSDDPDLARAMQNLSKEVARLNEHRFTRIHNSMIGLIWYQFLRGLAFGLGTAIGATLLVSVLVLFMRQIEVVPILGDLASRIIEEIQQAPETRR